MKKSEIFRRVAREYEKGRASWYSCHNIAESCDCGTTSRSYKYCEHAAWYANCFAESMDEFTDMVEHALSAPSTWGEYAANLRILMLCFAAAIAESEGD